MGNAIIVSLPYICMPLLHSGLVDLFLDYLAAWLALAYLSPLSYSGLAPVGDVERGSKSYLRNRYGEIMPVYRRNSHREVQAGSHEYPGEGIYLLKFDNSYSLLRNKTLFFHVYYTSWRNGKGQGRQAGNDECSRLPPSPATTWWALLCDRTKAQFCRLLFRHLTGFSPHPPSLLSQCRKVVPQAAAISVKLQGVCSVQASGWAFVSQLVNAQRPGSDGCGFDPLRWYEMKWKYSWSVTILWITFPSLLLHLHH